MRLLAVALLVVLALAGCSDEGEQSSSPVPAAGRGVTVHLPPGWQKAPESLTPRLTDPREVIAVGTFPMRFRDGPCSHMPRSALEDLGPRDALVALQERAAGGARFPDRPARFGPELGGPSESSECAPQARFTDHWFGFADRGRGFHTLVAFGPEATQATREEAWRILDSLVVD